MIPARNKQQDEPLCKFGPGGDFTYVWQPEIPESSISSSWLVKLLTSVVEVIAVLIGLKRHGPYVHLRNDFSSNELTVSCKEHVKNAFENPTALDTDNTSPTPVAEVGGLLSKDPLLFPDLGRNGIRIKHKPKHRIRTYHRTAKKRVAISSSKQSSLFESQFKSARTA
jgi:hypothetical protein